MSHTYTLNYMGRSRQISGWVAAPLMLFLLPVAMYFFWYVATIYIDVVNRYLGIGLWWTALLLAVVFAKLSYTIAGVERTVGILPAWVRTVMGVALVVLALFTLALTHETAKLLTVASLFLYLQAMRFRKIMREAKAEGAPPTSLSAKFKKGPHP
jgi:hypothetical protein